MTYYHGTSTACGLGHKLLPPALTGTLQEKGRKRNLDKVFLTKDFGSAMIYAGRAVQQFGGSPIVYRVIPMFLDNSKDPVCLNSSPGTTVYYCDWAFVEPI